MQPITILIAIAGGILLIFLIGWIVARAAEKAVQNAQQNDPWMQ